MKNSRFEVQYLRRELSRFNNLSRLSHNRETARKGACNTDTRLSHTLERLA